MAVENEPQGKYLSADGLKLHYHEFGTGFPVNYIHGAGPGASGWSNFKGNIAAFAEHHRTILFDMPQFGKSDKPVIKDERLKFIAASSMRSWRRWELRKCTSSAIHGRPGSN